MALRLYILWPSVALTLGYDKIYSKVGMNKLADNLYISHRFVSEVSNLVADNMRFTDFVHNLYFIKQNGH